MDQERFDRITRTLASGQSRRGVLKGVTGMAVGGLLAVAFGGSKATVARSNSECAHLCIEMFPPGKARGDCISQGARGQGPCVAVACVTNTVSVAATNDAWTPVGSFPVGDSLTISATGTAGHWSDGNYGPGGFDDPDSCGITVGTVPYPCGSLLGTFNPGNPGATFLIGSGTSVVVSGTGTLSALFNDLQGISFDGTTYHSDNHGEYSVTATNCAPTPV